MTDDADRTESGSRQSRTVLRGLQLFERWIVVALMVVVVIAGTVALAMDIVRSLTAAPTPLLDSDQLLHLFGFFFLILIGVELIETIKVYLVEDTIRVEVVLLVAIMALARKVVLVDFGEDSAGSLLALAAVMAALIGGYFLIKRSGR